MSDVVTQKLLDQDYFTNLSFSMDNGYWDILFNWWLEDPKYSSLGMWWYSYTIGTNGKIINSTGAQKRTPMNSFYEAVHVEDNGKYMVSFTTMNGKIFDYDLKATLFLDEGFLDETRDFYVTQNLQDKTLKIYSSVGMQQERERTWWDVFIDSFGGSDAGQWFKAIIIFIMFVARLA